MNRKNDSQKQVAEPIEISVTTISQYESDSRFPNEDIFKRLCLYYQISSDYLVELTDVKHSPLSQNEAKEKMMMSGQMDLISDLIDAIGKNNPEEY